MNPEFRGRQFLVVGALLALAGGLLAYQLFVPPPIGMADNGDFERIFPAVGLQHLSSEDKDKFSLSFNLKYRIVTPWAHANDYKTVTTAIVRLARWLSIASGRTRILDIRILALLDALLLLFGLGLLLAMTSSLPVTRRLLFGIVLVLVLTDVGYTAYFNSFYSEATAFCSLLIAVACSLAVISSPRWAPIGLATFFLAAAVVVTSKPMYAPLAPGLGLLGLHLSGRLRGRWRYPLTAGMVLALCLLGAWYYRQTSQRIRENNSFVVLFMDLIPHSRTPREDLIAFDLDPKFAGFSGQSPFNSDSPLNAPAIRTAMAERVGFYAIGRFYLTRPRRLGELIARCTKYAFSTRVKQLGYYTALAGKPPLAQPFGLWSCVREKAFPRSAWFLACFAATGVPALFLAIRARSEMRQLLLLLYVFFDFVAVTQLLVGALAGGEPDLEKHLFLFNLAFDGCCVLLLLAAIHPAFRASAQTAQHTDSAVTGHQEPPEGRPPRRRWLFSWLLLLVPVWGIGLYEGAHSLASLHSFANVCPGAPDYAALARLLPGRARLGFLTDAQPPGDWGRFYCAQHDLAPRVLEMWPMDSRYIDQKSLPGALLIVDMQAPDARDEVLRRLTSAAQQQSGTAHFERFEKDMLLVQITEK